MWRSTTTCAQQSGNPDNQHTDQGLGHNVLIWGEKNDCFPDRTKHATLRLMFHASLVEIRKQNGLIAIDTGFTLFDESGEIDKTSNIWKNLAKSGNSWSKELKRPQNAHILPGSALLGTSLLSVAEPSSLKGTLDKQ